MKEKLTAVLTYHVVPGRLSAKDLLEAEKINLLLSQYPLLRQICDRNVEIAADERAKEQKQRGARADAEAHVGIAQHSDLDQHQERDEQPDQDEKERRGKREVMHLAQVHRAPLSPLNRHRPRKRTIK